MTWDCANSMGTLRCRGRGERPASVSPSPVTLTWSLAWPRCGSFCARTPGTPWDYLCLYERDGERWRPLGSSSCLPADKDLLSGRPCAETSGPAVLLLPGRGGASMAGAQRAGNESTCPPTGRGWIAAETFRVSAEVQEVRVGPQRINVPDHGYFVVAWRSTSRHFPSARPPIICLDSHGTLLTRLNPGDYVDSATLASTAIN